MTLFDHIRQGAIIATLAWSVNLLVAASPVTAAEMAHGMPGHYVASAGGIDATMMLDPAVPAAKQKVTLILTLKRNGSDEPVAAEEVRIRWSMPAMGHAFDEKRAVPQRTAGTYRSTFTFPMDGKYQALIVVGGGSKAVELKIPITIGAGAHEHGHVGMEHAVD